MRDRNYAIANTIISNEEIKRKLPSIFTDSIILDCKFKMVVISNNVLDVLEFRLDELHGKDISYITGIVDFGSFLKDALQAGFFQEKDVELFSKNGKSVPAAISGFYLGLISDINGYIILKVQEVRSLEARNAELAEKRVELDSFIYRTAHDLRGPLATILGLINLYRMKKDEFDFDHLIQLINLHAGQLDEKLFRLLYLAEADQSFEEPTYTLNVKTMETYLRKQIESNSFIDFLDFQVYASIDSIAGLNERLVYSLVGNILHFLLHLPKSTIKNHQLGFFLSIVNQSLDIKIFARGFGIDDEAQNVIRNTETFYVDMLSHPELFNYFAALKIALRLKASIHMSFTNQFDHEIIISIPNAE